MQSTFSLRGESFTTRNFRRTPKEHRTKNRKLKGERRGVSPHQHYKTENTWQHKR
jgi:hypothetical protein